MITPVVLFDIPSTLSALPRTFLCKLPDGFERCFLLCLLIPLFPSARPVVVLLACLSFVPCILVHGADFEVTHDAPENVSIGAVFVYLAGFTASAAAPAEIGVIVKGLAGRKRVKPSD